MKPNLAVAASGRLYLADVPAFFTDLDDLEAWLIRIHNEVLTERHGEARPHCPDPRCHRLAHPDHANGHLLVGLPQDPKDRADSKRGMR